MALILRRPAVGARECPLREFHPARTRSAACTRWICEVPGRDL